MNKFSKNVPYTLNKCYNNIRYLFDIYKKERELRMKVFLKINNVNLILDKILSACSKGIEIYALGDLSKQDIDDLWNVSQNVKFIKGHEEIFLTNRLSVHHDEEKGNYARLELNNVKKIYQQWTDSGQLLYPYN